MSASSNKNVVLLYMAEQDEINLGVGFLSGALKKSGWKPWCLVWHMRPKIMETPVDQVLDSIKASDPACVCISVLSLHYSYIIQLLDRMHEVYKGPVIVGGYYAIAFPESLWRHPCVDAVCIGDGEAPVLDFLAACTKTEDAYGIQGLWGKKGTYFSSDWQGDHWYVSDLEHYPYIDFEMFDRIKPLCDRTNLYIGPSRQTLTILPAVSGRGCPYKCTYCSNALRMEKFPSKKTYLRKYSPKFLIKNLKQVAEQFNVQFIDFLDELFIYDTKWLTEFARLYKEQIRLPFSAQIHLGLITEPICEMMTDCGWILAAFGVECGDELYRKKYLKRSISNEMILKKAAMVKQAGVFTVALNMIGMPFETIDTMKSTLELNRKILPDLGMIFHWQPLPGTQLTDMARQNGLISLQDNCVTNYGTSAIHSEHENQIRKIHQQFLDEDFSFAGDKPDRLMEKLTTFSLDWINAGKPAVNIQ